MKTDSLNPDRKLYEAATRIFGKMEFPEIEYRCDILRQDRKGDISSPWAFSLGRVLPEAGTEEIAARLAAAVPNCRAEKGFLNFTFDPNDLAGRIFFLCDRFLSYSTENKIQVVLDDEAEPFLPAYYLYRAAECGQIGGCAADFTEERQKRVAELIAWCDILFEKKQRKALISAAKILAEQVYIWERSSRNDICHSNIFGAAGYIFSLCV